MKGEVEMNPLDLNLLVEVCGWGRSWRDGAGGSLLVGGRGKIPIETTMEIPTHGGASRADFAKVIPGQGGAGEVHPLGTGGAL